MIVLPNCNSDGRIVVWEWLTETRSRGHRRWSWAQMARKLDMSPKTVLNFIKRPLNSKFYTVERIIEGILRLEGLFRCYREGIFIFYAATREELLSDSELKEIKSPFKFDTDGKFISFRVGPIERVDGKEVKE